MTQQDAVRQTVKWSTRSKLKGELQRKLLAQLCGGKEVRARQAAERLDTVCKSANFRWRAKRVAVKVLVHRGKQPCILDMLRRVLGDAVTDLAVDSFDRHFAAVDAELARFAGPAEPLVHVLERKPQHSGFVR